MIQYHRLNIPSVIYWNPFNFLTLSHIMYIWKKIDLIVNKTHSHWWKPNTFYAYIINFFTAMMYHNFDVHSMELSCMPYNLAWRIIFGIWINKGTSLKNIGKKIWSYTKDNKWFIHRYIKRNTIPIFSYRFLS